MYPAQDRMFIPSLYYKKTNLDTCYVTLLQQMYNFMCTGSLVEQSMLRNMIIFVTGNIIEYKYLFLF